MLRLKRTTSSSEVVLQSAQEQLVIDTVECRGQVEQRDQRNLSIIVGGQRVG